MINVMSRAIYYTDFYSATEFPVNSELCGLLPACRRCHMDRKLCVLTSIVVFNTIFAWRTHMKIICVLHMVHQNAKCAWRCTIGCRSCFDCCFFTELTTEVEVYTDALKQRF